MPTPSAVEPPTPENIHLYRAAVLAWRKAEIEERSRHADIIFRKFIAWQPWSGFLALSSFGRPWASVSF
jgi:hypothetical protein